MRKLFEVTEEVMEGYHIDTIFQKRGITIKTSDYKPITDSLGMFYFILLPLSLEGEAYYAVCDDKRNYHFMRLENRDEITTALHTIANHEMELENSTRQNLLGDVSEAIFRWDEELVKDAISQKDDDGATATAFPESGTQPSKPLKIWANKEDPPF